MKSDWIDRSVHYLGRWGLRRYRFFVGVTELTGQALHDAVTVPSLENSAIRSVLLKQLYFTGFEAWKIIVLVALVLGTVIVSQVVGLVGNTNGSIIGKILVWVVFRELGPLLTAMIVIARSGTAMAAELGTMKINGELETHELLGIPFERYLLLPRIVGVSAAVAVLTVYFVLTAFVGGFLIASLGHHIPYVPFVQGIIASLGAQDIAALAIKTLSFGLAIPIICCHAGLSVGTSATEIPQAATRAVIISLLTVVLLDGLITFVATSAMQH